MKHLAKFVKYGLVGVSWIAVAYWLGNAEGVEPPVILVLLLAGSIAGGCLDDAIWALLQLMGRVK